MAIGAIVLVVLHFFAIGHPCLQETSSGLFVLSSTFQVKDAENIRGFRRTYGILVMNPSRTALLQLSRRLLERVQKIVAFMQV